jgi:hypothetical protein
MSRRADLVKSLLTDEEFLAIFKELKDNQLAGIENSRPEDSQAREHFYNRIQAINEIMGYLESVASDSKIKDARIKIL